MKWEVEHELYKEKLHRFKAERLELYALIIENCDDDLQNTIKNLLNFHSEIKDNSLMLLKVVETLMVDSTVIVRERKPHGVSLNKGKCLKDERIIEYEAEKMLNQSIPTLWWMPAL